MNFDKVFYFNRLRYLDCTIDGGLGKQKQALIRAICPVGDLARQVNGMNMLFGYLKFRL